jgi:3,4-dihydroxy-2-butanone 4-phosphate synthase
MVTLRYTPGGIRRRRGHTECAVGKSPSCPSEARTPIRCIGDVSLITDLCYLAGLEPAGLLCELVNPDDESGSMARRDDCWRFAKEWGLTIISVEDLAQWVEEKGVDLVPNA